MENITKTNKILQRIEEHIFYDVSPELKDQIQPARAKSGEVIYFLVKILVDKGILSVDDVNQALAGGKNDKETTDKGKDT